jgi:hypothetical protein
VHQLATVVVSSVIANKPRNGGNAWAVLSWVLGLKKLGFRVFFIEQIGRESCVDASGAIIAFEQSENLAYFKQVTERFGLADAAALIYEGGEQIHGPTYQELLEIAEAADLLVNITGHLTLEPLLLRLRRKAYVDLDPGFTQFWHASGDAGARLAGHDFYFTIGENIGTSSCSIPSNNIRWRSTRQPVVLDHWPVSTEGDDSRFTTVATWRGPYGSVQYGGKTFGLKVHEFRKFIALPEQMPQTFEIALDIHPAEETDLRLLNHHGWRLVDPREVVPDPDAFRRYVQDSGAEFSVAQGVYVETGSGWFSDRTVRYLASAKPVLVQDTGFSRNYPVGEGLVAFSTLEEAISGSVQVLRDYEKHSHAARTLAVEYFDSNKVLGRFVEEIDVAP